MAAHRSESSLLPTGPHPDYHDDYYTRPRSRHSVQNRHPHRHRQRSSSYDDLDAEHSQSHTREHSSHSQRTTSYHPQYRTAMYASTKNASPALPPEYQQRRHSSTQILSVARRHGDEDALSEYRESEPPRHARHSRANRHSTFPPSSYHRSPQQKQVQLYQQPYVHPAIPPQSPMLDLARAGTYQQHKSISQPRIPYEAPRYTYQPPTADFERPRQPARAESWGHSTVAHSGAGTRMSSRKGSVSVPPSSRSLPGDARERSNEDPKGPWDKAKKMCKSKTASNTAEIAMFGLLAVAKAL